MRRPSPSLRALALALACALPAAAARGEQAAPAGTPAPAPPELPALPPVVSPGALDAPPASQKVEIRTDDGFTLHGDLVAARDPQAPVAILLHQYMDERRSWRPLVPGLAEAGYSVLALDQRAHGESTRQGSRRVLAHEMPRAQFGAVVRDGVRDVAAARAFLAARGLGTDRIALVGASYGCTVSLLAASRVAGVRALVLLSPGTDYFGVDVTEATRGFGGPLLAIAAEDDRPSANSVRRLLEVHEGAEESIVLPSGGHGTNLLSSRPELESLILRFLAKTFAS